jgi:hypothetical protein
MHGGIGMSGDSVYARAAERYRPNAVRLLWIAESPPPVKDGEEPRYFYFDPMTRHDSLFREIMKTMFPGCAVPSTGQSKRGLLTRFRDAGAFLIDICEGPRVRSYEQGWVTAERKVLDLNPDGIIAVKADVCRFVQRQLSRIGLSDRLLTREPVPFPGSGQQRRFHAIVDSVVRRWLERPRGGCASRLR